MKSLAYSATTWMLFKRHESNINNVNFLFLENKIKIQASEFLQNFLNFIKQFANAAFEEKPFQDDEDGYSFTFNWEPLRPDNQLAVAWKKTFLLMLQMSFRRKLMVSTSNFTYYIFIFK